MTAGNPTPTTSTTSSAAAGGRTLDSVYQAMLAAAKAGSITETNADGWNYFVMQSTPSIVAPDPVPLFTAANSSWQRADNMTAAQYWAVMGPALKTQYGLSGLGFYATAFRGMRPRTMSRRGRV